MKSRRVVFALVLALVLCMMGSVAMAANLPAANTTLTGTTSYTLTSDIVATGTPATFIEYYNGTYGPYTKYVQYKIDGNITIDLAGHDITADTATVFGLFGDSAKLTLTNSSSKQSTISTKNDFVFRVLDGAQLTIGDNILVSSNTSGIYFHDGAKVDVACDVIVDGCYAIASNGSTPANPTTLTVRGDAVIKSKSTDEGDVAIFHPQDGTMTLQDNVSVSGNVGVALRAGSLTIKDNAKVATTSSAESDIVSTGDGAGSKNIAVAVAQHVTNIATSVTIQDNAQIIAPGDASAIYAVAQEANTSKPVTVTIKSGTVDGAIIKGIGHDDFDVAVTGGTFNHYSVIEHARSTTAFVGEEADDGAYYGKIMVGINNIVDAITENCLIEVMKGNLDINVDVSVNVFNGSGGTVKINGITVPEWDEINNPYPTVITVSAPSLKNRAPQTGDESNIVLWAAMMALSAAAFVVLSKKARFN